MKSEKKGDHYMKNVKPDSLPNDEKLSIFATA